MEKYESLKLNKEFRFLYSSKTNFVTPSVVVYIKKNNRKINRLGITSGKKIGNAVKRNRARRIIRVAYRNLLSHFNACYDIVIVARSKATFVKMQTVEKDLKECFIKAGILKDENNS